MVFNKSWYKKFKSKYVLLIIIYIFSMFLIITVIDYKLDFRNKEKVLGITNANAITTNEVTVIPGNGTWMPTKLMLTVNKTRNSSYFFYTNQITFQSDTKDACGAQFKMRVRDGAGIYIMPDMITGAFTHDANVYHNAMLSDTVYHEPNGGNPPKGTYTFELWALAGCGNLTIVPYMSNIAVLELPVW